MAKQQVSKALPIEFSEVCEVLYQDLLGTNGRTLLDAFTEANTDLVARPFDPNYVGVKDRLTNWRGYPVIPITCGTGVGFDGGQAYPSTHEYDLGTATGESTVTYEMQGVPDRVLVTWNGSIVMDSGYRGDPAFDLNGNQNRINFKTALAGLVDPVNGLTYPNTGAWPDDGYPRILGDGTGSGTFLKTSASPSDVTVDVYGPMSGTDWDIFGVSCPVPTVPEAPTSLTATSITQGTFTLGWTAPASGPTPTGYKVYKNGGLYGDVELVTSEAIIGQTSDTSATWTVVAYNASGDGPASAGKVVLQTKDVTSWTLNATSQVDGATACAQSINTTFWKTGSASQVDQNDEFYTEATANNLHSGNNEYWSDGTDSFIITIGGLVGSIPVSC